MDAPIPVTVVTGFLGAGKSTLLDRWLQDLPGDTAVIVNEQGEVGIDGALLSDRTSRLLEITGGCVCCTTRAALDAALTDFARATPPPSRIVVETSGAASPAAVIQALTLGTARDELRLDGVVTVLDAARAPRALKFDLAIEQLGFADVVVLSHVDECDSDTLASLTARLPDYAPAAVHVQARHGRVDAAAGTLVEILDARDEALREVPTGHGRSHPAMDAVSLVFDGEVDEERFADWVQAELGARQSKIARVKGIVAVRGVDERVILQGVGQAVEVTLGRPWGEGPRTSRLVVLGLDLDADALQHGFTACTLA